MPIPALLVALLLLVAAPARAQDLVRVATWNIANLHSVIGEPLRPGAAARTEADYATLRRYVGRLDADIVALQEVNGPAAARLVFPEAEYELHIDGRYADDLVTGRESDRIYTGFAVRRGRFTSVVKRDVPELSVAHTDGRPVRWGTEILVERGAARLRLLSVHLKSGCADGALDPPTGADVDCVTLSKQRAPLEAWIDSAARGEIAFGILGDFNRRFDRFGADDHLWRDIDDRDPPGLNLWRLPFRTVSQCWIGTRRHFPDPVDFLVFDDRAWDLVDEASFAELTYDAADQDVARGTPSDHCARSVSLRL